LDVLAAIAYFTRQSGDAILPNLPAQVFDSNNSCLHSCRHFWPQVEIFFWAGTEKIPNIPPEHGGIGSPSPLAILPQLFDERDGFDVVQFVKTRTFE
jgi:hypothetical protein